MNQKLPPVSSPTVSVFPKNAAQLSASQKVGVWGCVIGATFACTAWMMAYAGMAKDWLPVVLTIVVDVVVAAVIGALCVRPGAKRFLLMGLLVLLLIGHSLVLFWLRFDHWREGSPLSVDQLLREKRMVVFTVIGMVVLLLGQFGLIHWLQSRSVKNTTRR